jgi:Putative phage tail protein/Concanavalin A-like lectin/glucanases superfamily/Fibronectin type III domain
MGQILPYIGAAVGAVVGAYAGGNAVYGAELGFAIGSLGSAILFPQKLSGPRTNLLQATTSNYGHLLPFGKGNFRVPGIIIWQLPIQEGSSSGGKGGPQVTQYSYYGTFAVALCEGPISGVRKIWANGICIYDVGADADPATVVASNQYAALHLTFYKGDFTQNPDPTMEAALGIGNVPGYRGTAYILFNYIPLANFGNVLPAISAEVVTPSLTGAVVQVWINSTTAFPYSNSAFPGPYPMVTGFASGAARSIGHNFATGISDGFVYRVDMSNGAVLSTDAQNGFEAHLKLGGSFFHLPGGSALGSVMPQYQQSAGVFGHQPGSVQIIGHVSNDSHAVLVGCIYLDGAVNGDVIAALSVPTGGNWYLEAHFPCADWAHLAVVTSDGSTNCWLHILSIDKYGVPGELARYPFASYSDMTTYVQSTRTWAADPGFSGGAPPAGMLESDLLHFWCVGSSAVRFAVVSGSVVLSSPALSSGLPGGGSIYADAGICIGISNQTAICWAANQLSARTQINLSDVVSDLCARAGIPSASVDVTALTDQVWGFFIDRQMAVRAALEALSPAFWFDAVESDGKLKFVKRSSTAIVTIPLDDMVVEPGKNAPPLSIIRGSEIELPAEIQVSYYAIDGDYQPGMQYARRRTTFAAGNPTVIDSGAVMDDTQAAVAAAVIEWDTYQGRTSFKCSTPYGTPHFGYAQLEPTDVVYLSSPNELYLARITHKIENGSRIEWEAVACAPVYSQLASGGAITAGQTVAGALSTNAYLLDLPPLRDADGLSPSLYVAAYGDPGWPGMTLYKSSDGGADFVAGIIMSHATVVGQATSALGNWTGGNVFDEVNSVTIKFFGSWNPVPISSASRLAVLNGANVMLVGNEILQFRTATAVSSDTYTLTGLLRGRLATESAMAGHGIGDRCVLLTSNLGLQATPSSDIGQPRIYEAITIGQPLGSGLQQTITEQANNLRCFSPVHLFATNNGVAGDITLQWIRRNRITWQWLPEVDVPMSEATEAYTVSIFNLAGTSVLRTISVSGTGVQTATYTAAQQVTDFGAALNPGTSFTFGVQQISAVTGAGAMAKMTLILSGATVPGAPTIGTATAGNAQASVAFTPPASTGGSPITSYTATSSPGGITGSGSSSPVVVTGLTNGVAYTFTVTATNAVGTGPASGASNSVTPGAGVNAKVLLHFDGTSGTPTFTDVYGHTFSSAGGSTVISNAQFKWGNASLSLNGSNQGIRALPSGTEFDLQGDYTIEGWIYYNTVSTAVNQGFASRDDGGGATHKWGYGLNTLGTNGWYLHRNGSGAGPNLNWPWAPTANTWYHIAMVHAGVGSSANNGGTIFFVNGVSQGVVTDAFPMPIPTTDLNMAIGFLEEGAWYMNGFVDDFRLSDVVRYPNFTPPNSAYSSGTGIHLVHFDGAGGSTTFTDNGSNPVTVTAGGTGAVETGTVKFGSGALNCGTQAGWASLAHDADQEFGTGDFTIDCWCYLTALPTSGQTQATLFAKMPNSPSMDAYQVGVNTSGQLFFYMASSPHGGLWDVQMVSTDTFSINQWHHVAAVRHGALAMLFVDGNVVAMGNVGSLSLYSSATSLVRIGTYDGAGDYGWIGYIDEFHMDNAADWTENFTPPAGPFSN